MTERLPVGRSIAFQSNEPTQRPDTNKRRYIAVSLLALGIALVTFNVAAYRYTRLMEHQYRRSLTEVRPWIWPEGALALFMLAWGSILIASTVAAFRLRNRLLKYVALFFAVGAVLL